MPIVVELPDKTEIEFPDGMDNLAIHREIVKAFPNLGERTPSEQPSLPEPGAQRIGTPAPSPLEVGQPPSQLAQVQEAARQQGAERAAQGTGEVAEIGGQGDLQFPKVTAQDLTTLGVPESLAKPLAGTQQAITEVADFFLTPEGISTLGIGSIGPAAQKAVATYFVGQMAKEAPRQFAEAYKAFKEGDSEKGTRMLVGGALGTTFVGLGARELLHRSAAELRKPSTSKESDASQVSPTAEVHGDVHSQQEPAELLPVKESGAGVQPQAEGRVQEPVVPPRADEQRGQPQAQAAELGDVERITARLNEIEQALGPRDTFNPVTNKPEPARIVTNEERSLLEQLDELNKSKPPPVESETAPPSEAPAAAAVSESESPGVAAPGVPPDVAEATPLDPLIQQAKPEEPVREAPSPQPRAGTEVQQQAQPESTTPAGKVEPAGGDSIGPGAASVKDVPPPTGGEDVTGVAQRVREKVAAAGQEDLPPRGAGIAPEDSVERGRELLAQGADPEKIMSAFEKDQRVSSADMAVARAHLEKLAFDARRAEEKFGTDSPEWRAAHEARSQWAARVKKMQTEWAKTGHAQQGEVDIDTGSFTGLASAYRDATGKDFTPQQTGTAKKKAATVKQANEQEAAAKQKLFRHAESTRDRTAAEQAAIDAANKVIIDWAAKRSELETKKRVADQKRLTELDRIESERQAKVKAAASKTAIDAANKAAREARAAAEETAKRTKAAADEQLKAEKKALDAANKVVRDNAARIAKESTADRVRREKLLKESAELLRKDEAAAQKIADKVKRDATIKLARDAAKDREARADVPAYAWKLAREYIDKGMGDWDEIRHAIATDMGLPVNDVTTALAKDKRAKYLTDEVWRAQQRARQLRAQTKQWVADQAVSGLQRALSKIPRLLFSLKVGFHGTVALGTHAPMVAFQPRFWAAYVRDFGKMYRMVGSPFRQGKAQAYYEMQVQDLLRRPNYMVSRRAGLVNDPFQFEDYNSPDTSSYFGKITTMGNRGYSVLKILRQDMFDQQWNQLPKTAKIPEMAEAIADAVNHATGVVKGKAPRGTNIALFAPRLEGSRVMWLAGDPIRAADTFLHWRTANSWEKAFALNQIKEKAWVAGTMLSALALNQGFLSAIGSKQKVNVTNPMESDFLRFKVGGMQASYGSAMVNMAKLPGKLALAIAFRGKLGKVVLEDERVSKVLFDYARSQASPFASVAIDLATGRDYAERPLPRKLFGTLPGDTDIPRRLRMHGITKPYSWTEWTSEEFTPIPIEEGLKEVWSKGMGMTEAQQKEAMKALLTISFMSATGGRLTEDFPAKK